MAKRKPISDITPWSYRTKTSPLHKLPAGIKLISLLVLSFAVFFPSIIVLACIVFILILLSFIADLRPWSLLKGSFPLFIFIFSILLFKAVEFSPLRFSFSGAKEGLIFCVRLAAVFSAGTLFFAVTTIDAIRKALTYFEKSLHLEKLRIGLALALMLGFLKRFFEVWEETTLAWKSRCGRRGLLQITTLIPSILEKMIVKAGDTAAAMESRGVSL